MRTSSYLTLDLLVEKNGDGYRARVIDSPAGQASEDFASPFTAAELQNFLARVGRRAPMVGTGVKPEELLKQFGTRLFDAAFHGETLTGFRRSRDAAEREGKGLRVKLRLNDVPALGDLPWEYLYDATRQRFLALSKETPIVRFIDVPERVEPLSAPAPLNLIAVLASPRDYDALDVEAEWQRLNDATRELRGQNKITLTRVTPPTLDALRAQLLKKEYHIFHFVGHGDYDAEQQHGSLLFEDNEGAGDAVTDERLATLLHDVDSLRVALLNACEGGRASAQNPFAGVAPRLVQQGIPAVIAMQFPITDNAAVQFSANVYATVADGFPIDAAVNEARRALYFGGSVLEWGTPILFMRAEDGMIFAKEDEMEDERRTPKDERRETRGGINVSGGSLHVGGDMVGGDKIVHGDDIHAGGDVNKVTIGAGASVGQVAAGKNITQTQGASAQDLATFFNAIYKQIDARPDDPNVERDEIRETVKKVQDEISKGNAANPTRVERLLRNLKEIAPDILKVTADAILNPLAGITTAIKLIAEKIRAS